ncbi:MAG TPA: hypothetical protein VFK05_06485 [Polyangiaceae bacterium]|nr:hypothetical protein [Polyangiaceae bacterium]
MHKWSPWLVLIALGCNGKITVPEPHPVGAVGGFGGRNAGGAGAFGGSGPGAVGQDCIPAALVTEADGSPAKTTIQTLTRCDEGLSCNAQGKCVSMPDCPQDSGPCVVRRATLHEDSGVGGSSGAGGSPFGGGTGGTPNATDETGVVALAANDSHLYWLEYGTRDALGNYEDDGALMSYAIAEGTTTVIASQLAGPMGLGLTPTHIYVYVDGGPLVGAPTHPQLLRLPLGGGSPELVQDGAQAGGFVAVGSRVFFATGAEVYSVSSDSEATPSLFLAEQTYNLTSDGSDLYYVAFDSQLMRSPLTAAAPKTVGFQANYFALYGDGIFTPNQVDGGGVLSRVPKRGGEFVRVRALGACSPGRQQVVGDRYFLQVSPVRDGGADPSKQQILTAGFLDDNPPIRLLERATRLPIDHLWVGTAAALYWSDGRAIYEQRLPAQ